MARHIPLGPGHLLREGQFVSVPVWPPHPVDRNVLARSAIVGRHEGELIAYANVCRHHAIPLDLAGDGNVMTDDRTLLLCHHHGALFEPGTGMCIAGPCVGERLWPLHMQTVRGRAELVLEPPPPTPSRAAVPRPIEPRDDEPASNEPTASSTRSDAEHAPDAAPQLRSK